MASLYEAAGPSGLVMPDNSGAMVKKEPRLWDAREQQKGQKQVLLLQQEQKPQRLQLLRPEQQHKEEEEKESGDHMTGPSGLVLPANNYVVQIGARSWDVKEQQGQLQLLQPEPAHQQQGQVRLQLQPEQKPHVQQPLQQQEPQQAQQQQQEEDDEKLYECGGCMEQFSLYANLKQHVKTMKILRQQKRTNHPIKPHITFNCVKCRRTFYTIFKLQAHMQSHPCMKNIECTVCKKRFSRQYYLDRHMRSHTGEKPFECPVCHQCFSQRCAIKWHMERHSDVFKYKCELCPGGKLFKTNQDLKGHILTHRREKKHVCQFCGKKFLRRYDKTSHERRHLGIARFECEFCAMQFDHSGKLKNHIRMHTEEPEPWKCELCLVGFKTRAEQQEHMIKEKGKPEETRCDKISTSM